MRRARAVLGALALLGAGACRVTLGLDDVERLERELQARTVVLEEEFTLWTPFDVVGARDWVRLVAEELAAVRAVFEVPGGERMLVRLVPLEGLGVSASMEGDQVRFEAPGPVPLGGVAGATRDREVTVFVPPPRALRGPEGREITLVEGPEARRRIVRHELAHAFAARAGLSGPDWFDEGIAQYVESLALVDGRLVDRGAPVELLLAARKMPVESRGLERLLAWHEDGLRVMRGEERVDVGARTLCSLLLRFQLEQRPEPGLVARLRAVGELPRAELLDQEQAWQAWLRGGPVVRAREGLPRAPRTAGAGKRASAR